MIICTGCGSKNDDEARHCAKCRKKLQSSRQAVVNGSCDLPPPLGRFTHVGLPEKRMLSLRRLIEAWLCVLTLLAVGGVCLYQETWWPLYPTVCVLGLIAWLRRL